MTQKSFNKYQVRGAYHWEWYRTNKNSYRDYAIQTLNYFPRSGSLLDIGCGDGRLAYVFFLHGFIVNGIDLDSVGIELGQREILKHYFLSRPHEIFQALLSGNLLSYVENKGIRLQQLSIYDFSSTNEYQYSICMEVIEHVPEPQFLVEKILQVTREYAVLSTPNGEYCQPADEDYQFWTPDEFMKMLGSERSQLLHVSRDRIFVRLSNKAENRKISLF